MTANHNQIQQTEKIHRMMASEYLTFQKSLLNKKCEQQGEHINLFASLLFCREWKSHPYSFILTGPSKNKPQNTQVSLKSEILNWFKSLSTQEKLDVISIRDRKFIQKFLKFSGLNYQKKLVNFPKGYSIPNILNIETKKSNFLQIKIFLCVALTSQPLLFLNCESAKLCEEILEWLDQITAGKVFEFANKIISKQEPQDNILWFNSMSMYPLESWLANQFQKSITKHYFKKDLLPNYKLKEFTDYMISKHPSQVKYLKLPIDEARKLTHEEFQTFFSVIKNYQNSYYQDVRANFIKTLENLQNHKQQKKRKTKRKPKKKNTSTPHNNQSNLQIQVVSPHKKACHSQDQNNSDQKKQSPIIDGNHLAQQKLQTLDGSYQKQNQCALKQEKFQQKSKESPSKKNELDTKQNQSTVQFRMDKEPKKHNKSEQGKGKKCTCKDETSSQITKNQKGRQKKKQKSNSKNLVMNKQRSRSPFSKSNTIDNDCSKSIFSGQMYDTLTQAIIQEYTTKAEQFQQLAFTQKHDKAQLTQINTQKKPRRRRNKNQKSNRQIQQLAKNGSIGLINKQLTNFIDSLSIQTNNLYQSKVICFQRVRYFIKTLFPCVEAMLFGSNSMGLSLPSSDVDIMLYNVQCKNQQEIKDMLAQIAIEINAMGWIVSCSTYLNAKAPLVKLQIDPLISYFQTKRRCDYPTVYDPMILYFLDIKDRKKARNMCVDLTINLQQKNGAYSPSNQLMRSWVNADPTLQRIILLFKYILAEKGYNKNFNGGLGSYCLFIMIAAYFTQFKNEFPQDEGKIFLNILKFYSEDFENKLKSITLRENASCFMSLEESLGIVDFSQVILLNPLRIIDPLTQKVISSSCSQYQTIKLEFRRIRAQIIGEMQTIERQIITNYPSVGLNKVEVTQKSIEKWIHKYELRTKFSIKKIIDGSNERN